MQRRIKVPTLSQKLPEFSLSAIKLVCYERPQFVESQKKGFSTYSDILQILCCVLIFALLGYVVFRSTRNRSKQPEPELSVDCCWRLLQITTMENLKISGLRNPEVIEKFVDENPHAAALSCFCLSMERKFNIPVDYDNMKEVYRPSHADYTYKVKYGIRDYRGGGRSSARETISRVVAGALAKQALRQLGVRITAYTSQVGPIRLEENYTAYDLDLIDTNPVRCPDPVKAKEMEELIFKIKGEGDTIGGVVTCVIKGCPIGLGQPVFGKLHASLASAMLSINAAKAFEYGDGFKGLKQKGSEQNDVFFNNCGRIETKTNHSGGIQGGISNGGKKISCPLLMPP